jgi:hypothetical protein
MLPATCSASPNIDRALPMRATVPGAGSGALRSSRSAGYAAIRSSGHFPPKFDLSQYIEGCRP